MAEQEASPKVGVWVGAWLVTAFLVLAFAKIGDDGTADAAMALCKQAVTSEVAAPAGVLRWKSASIDLLDTGYRVMGVTRLSPALGPDRRITFMCDTTRSGLAVVHLAVTR